jgi:hypothetical protein
MRVKAMLLAALFATLLSTACSSSKSSPDGGGGSPVAVSGTRTLTGTELAYGPSVGAIPGAVYQPAVVFAALSASSCC